LRPAAKLAIKSQQRFESIVPMRENGPVVAIVQAATS
jgi:hypothetical protein